MDRAGCRHYIVKFCNCSRDDLTLSRPAITVAKNDAAGHCSESLFRSSRGVTVKAQQPG